MKSQIALKKEHLEEIVRCGKDPVYFINKYVKIQHPLKGTIPFKTFPFQNDCIRAYQEKRLNIVLKSRQLGLSTISAAYAVWYSIFYRDKNILVIATKLAVAMNFIKKVKHMLDNLPSWLLLPEFEPSNQKIRFNNGSQILAIPTSEDAGRSEALSLLIIDEAAFIRNFDDLWAGLYPTLSTGGRAIIISTPNGVGGQYYKLWVNAEAGLNEFNPISLPWYVHPEHDEVWFENECRQLPKRKIAQELLCDFVASGDTFLQADVISSLKEDATPPIEKTGVDRGIWVWKHQKPEHSYIISADVARGDASDFSAFHIIDEVSSEVVVEYAGKLPPEIFADLLYEWAQKYNEAYVVVENNTFGYTVNVRFREAGYKKIHYNKKPRNYVSQDSSELPGFSTQKDTRILILTKLEEVLRNKVVRIYSERFLQQINAFVWKGHKPMASKESNDDLVLSLAMGVWLLSDNGSKEKDDSSVTLALLKTISIEKRETTALPISGNDQFTRMGRAQIPAHMPRDPSLVRNINQYDYSWLFK